MKLTQEQADALLAASKRPGRGAYMYMINASNSLMAQLMAQRKSVLGIPQQFPMSDKERTLYPGREREFWIWCASWGLFLQKPSDLGFSDVGYDLPPLNVHYHKLESVQRKAEFDMDGQMKLGHDAAMGLADAAREKRDSIDIRTAETARIVQQNPYEHFVIWHDLEDERRALKRAIPEMVDIYGSMDLETREQRVVDFSQGRTRLFGTKKSLSGSGCNFQRYCHRAILKAKSRE